MSNTMQLASTRLLLINGGDLVDPKVGASGRRRKKINVPQISSFFGGCNSNVFGK